MEDAESEVSDVGRVPSDRQILTPIRQGSVAVGKLSDFVLRTDSYQAKMSGKYAFTKSLREVRFLFCQSSEHSAATRFVLMIL